MIQLPDTRTWVPDMTAGGSPIIDFYEFLAISLVMALAAFIVYVEREK